MLFFFFGSVSVFVFRCMFSYHYYTWLFILYPDSDMYCHGAPQALLAARSASRPQGPRRGAAPFAGSEIDPDCRDDFLFFYWTAYIQTIYIKNRSIKIQSKSKKLNQKFYLNLHVYLFQTINKVILLYQLYHHKTIKPVNVILTGSLIFSKIKFEWNFLEWNFPTIIWQVWSDTKNYNQSQYKIEGPAICNHI